MRSFRTSVVFAAAVAALSWSSVSNAQDTAKSGKDTSSESTKSTTKTKSSTKKTTSSGSKSDTSTPSTGTSTSGSTTDTTGTGTSGTGTTGTGTSGTGTMDMTGTTGTTGTTTTTTPPPTGTMPPSSTTPPPAGTYGTEPYGTQPYSSTTTTATTTTTGAEYQEPVGAEKAGYTYRPNRIMLGTGAVLLVGPYVAGAIVAASNSHSYDDKLYWPVAGPWIDLAERPCNNFNCGTAEDWNQILLVADGIAQGAGVALMLVSLAVPEHHEAAATAKATPRERSLAASKPKMQVTPLNVRGGAGVGAVGVF